MVLSSKLVVGGLVVEVGNGEVIVIWMFGDIFFSKLFLGGNTRLILVVDALAVLFEVDVLIPRCILVVRQRLGVTAIGELNGLQIQMVFGDGI